MCEKDKIGDVKPHIDRDINIDINIDSDNVNNDIEHILDAFMIETAMEQTQILWAGLVKYAIRSSHRNVIEERGNILHRQ